jgi:hypothetical protein
MISSGVYIRLFIVNNKLSWTEVRVLLCVQKRATGAVLVS